MKKLEIETIIERFYQSNPNPKIELFSTNPFTLLIAVLLSAQATDKGVNKATPDFFKAADTPESMLKLGLDKIKSYIKTIGLFNTKANNIIKLCHILIDKFDSQIPSTREGLESLPGVGRKTANVVLYNVFNIPTIAVDTHVFRASNRIGLCKTKTPLATENALVKKIPNQHLGKMHHWLVLHGRYTCKAIKPECSKCVINDICKYQNKNF